MPEFSKRSALFLLPLCATAALIYLKREALLQIVTVFIFAAAFTLMLLPLCAALERRGMGAPMAALCAVGALLALVLLLVSAFIPYLASHTIALIRSVTPTLNALLRQSGALLEQFGLQGAQRSGLTEMIAASVSQMTGALARASVSFAAQAGQIVFSLVIAYYLLRERQIIGNHLLLCIPLAWRTAFLSALRGCKNAVLSYLSGVLKTSLFVGGATLLGLLLLGIRDALLLSIFMGVLEVLPYIGPVLAAVPIVLTALSQGVSRALLALALVVLVQQVESSFISPYFTASSTSIHPLAALVSVFSLGCLMGVWGILLAVPLVVTARSVLWSVRQAQLLTQS